MDTPSTRDHSRRVDDDASRGKEMQQAAAEKAAMESVSPSLVLPGEDTTSQHLEDAKHWIVVYSELYGFTGDIVAQFHHGIGELPGEARVYLESHDLLVHERQVQRFAERLSFWKERAAELERAGANRDGTG